MDAAHLAEFLESRNLDLDQLRVGARPEWFIETKPERWFDQIVCGRLTAIRVATGVVEMLLPEWSDTQPEDKIPIKVIESAREAGSVIDAGMRNHMSVLAKACTRSRRRTLGSYHRIAEATRAVAHAVMCASDSAAREAAAEALAKTEEHILYRYSVAAVYGKEHEVRRDMFARVVEALSS